MNNKKGLTLMELMIVIALGAIVLFFVGSIYVQFIKGNTTLRTQMFLRENIARANHLLERDIRMAGFNLPGNGIKLDLSTEGENEIVILNNDNGRQTILEEKAFSNNDSIIVEDASGIVAQDWFCLHDSSNDRTSYYEISGIIPQEDETYIIKIDNENLTDNWEIAETDVYFARGIRYSIESNGVAKRLVRRSQSSVYDFSASIEKITIIPKDEHGQILTSDFLQTRTMIIELVKQTNGAGTSDATSSVEIKIRNCS